MSKYHCDCECTKCYGKYFTMHVKAREIDTIIIKCAACGYEMIVDRDAIQKVE